MKIKIIVACHKPYNVPKSNIFYPIEVGAINHQNNFLQLRDDLGDDNISKKNSSYCELTAIYWAWKNMDYDVIGLCHYRRYFSIKRKILFDNIKYIIDEKHIKKALDKYDFILPRLTKMKVSNYDHGNFYMENGKVVIYNDHHFDITRDVIKEYYPDYLESFDIVMSKKSGHFLNMFIAKKEVANKYFEWLFDILSKVEERYEFTNPYPASERVFGYIAENMIDVFILKNHLSFIERDLVYLERKNIFIRTIDKIKKRFKK